MYEETEAKYPAASMNAAVQARRLDITLRQNIDERIKQAQAHVAEWFKTHRWLTFQAFTLEPGQGI